MVNKVITTMVIRPLDDPHNMRSICGRRFGCNFKVGIFDPRFVGRGAVGVGDGSIR